jgi:hypothetical protein
LLEAVAKGAARPEAAGRTALYMTLRACERFGIDPRDIDDMEPGLREQILAFELVRMTEEAAEQ